MTLKQVHIDKEMRDIIAKFLYDVNPYDWRRVYDKTRFEMIGMEVLIDRIKGNLKRV